MAASTLISCHYASILNNRISPCLEAKNRMVRHRHKWRVGSASFCKSQSFALQDVIRKSTLQTTVICCFIYLTAALDRVPCWPLYLGERGCLLVHMRCVRKDACGSTALVNQWLYCGQLDAGGCVLWGSAVHCTERNSVMAGGGGVH